MLEIVGVSESGQAALRGIHVGQRVVEFEGVKVTSMEVLLKALSKAKQAAADAGSTEVTVGLVEARARRPSVF